MCGLSGYLTLQKYESRSTPILNMNKAIAHRGPDDEGFVLIGEKAKNFLGPDSASLNASIETLNPSNSIQHSIAIGHRRFSILGPSIENHQPYWSANNEICLSFNGEIYNYVELRHELSNFGFKFRGEGDTEVLCAAFLQWGVHCFNRLQGFWAIVIYDSRKNLLLLSRDRIGKAPLYWVNKNEKFWWSSEIKGIMAGMETTNFSINPDSLFAFVKYAKRDIGNSTFYSDIKTFPSGSYAWINSDGSFSPQIYWEIPKSRNVYSNISTSEIIQKFRATLSQAVEVRLRSDVPIAVELSGGLDSSAITTLALEHLKVGEKLKAYTVSFTGHKEDETPFAEELIQKHSTQIDLIKVEYRPPHFFSEGFDYIHHMDEPFHSPNMVSNQDLWRAMKANGIKVSLNGGGGDEVLAGYSSEYFHLFLLSLLKEGRMNRFFDEFSKFSEHDENHILISYVREVFHLLPELLRNKLKTPTPHFEHDPLIHSLNNSVFFDSSKFSRMNSNSMNQRLIDNMGDGRMNYWMRSGNLSCMQVPMEVRLPFLDHKLIDFVFQLPTKYLIRDGWLKWILRKTFENSIPEKVLWRKRKTGFPFPLQKWLQESKPNFVNLSKQLDCPYINSKKLILEYDFLSIHYPNYLWRMLSTGLWWVRNVQGKNLF